MRGRLETTPWDTIVLGAIRLIAREMVDRRALEWRIASG